MRHGGHSPQRRAFYAAPWHAPHTFKSHTPFRKTQAASTSFVIYTWARSYISRIQQLQAFSAFQRKNSNLSEIPGRSSTSQMLSSASFMYRGNVQATPSRWTWISTTCRKPAPAPATLAVSAPSCCWQCCCCGVSHEFKKLHVTWCCVMIGVSCALCRGETSEISAVHCMLMIVARRARTTQSDQPLPRRLLALG